MSTAITTGAGTILLDERKLLELMDRVSDGAASSFVDRSSRVLTGIADRARPQFPEATGEAKRSFNQDVSVRPTQIKVSETNTARNQFGAYAFKMRWSRFTEAEVKAQAERLTDAMVTYGESAIARGSDTGKRARIAYRIYEVLAVRAGLMIPPGGLKSRKDVSKAWGARARHYHGTGAPSQAVAGKQPWRLLVRTPADDAFPRLVAELQADLVKLAAEG